jgi:hypothetical protein
MFGADETSIRNWEKDTYRPAKRLMARINKFLAYDPQLK